MSEDQKIETLGTTQQLINFNLDYVDKFLKTNSNVNKQDKKHNNTDVRNKNYRDKQQFNPQESIDSSDLKQFLKNRNDLKTLKKVEDLIERKSKSGNPYINYNNEKQFDKELSFDDDMVKLELSQEDKNPNYQNKKNDDKRFLYLYNNTQGSFDDSKNDNEKNNDEFFYDVFNNPQEDRIDFSEFNKKGTKNILIEDNGDKTNNIAALYRQAIKKIREHESLTKKETDAIRLVEAYANILDENVQSTHKKTNKFKNKAKYNDNKQYPLENNTLYQFNMSKYDIQKNKFSKNNNYKKNKKPVNIDNLKKNRLKSLLDEIRQNNAQKIKKKHFNANNLKNNRKEMLSYSDDIRGKNAKNMKKKHFNANAQSWNYCYKKNPVSAVLKNKQEWLDHYSSPMFSTKQKYNNLKEMEKNPLLNSKDIQEFKDKFNLK